MNRGSAITLAALCGALAIGGCILEDNPAFVDSGTGGTDSTSAGTESDTTVSTTDSTTDSQSTTDSVTDSDTDGTTGGPVEPPPTQGCDEPDCPVIHVGFDPNDCIRTEDGAELTACDYDGRWALRVAMAKVELLGGARVILYDRDGVPATFDGGLEVPGHTTIIAAPGTPHSNLRIRWNSEPTETDDTIRLRGDDVHLKGFTVITESGGQRGIVFWATGVEEGTETGGHLIENLELIASGPEDVGGNSITPVFGTVGRDTTIRNCRVWGYHEGGMALQQGRGFRFHNNTLVYYQPAGSPAFDVTGSNDIEISNNVWVSLARQSQTFVLADATTQNLTVVGNVVEGAGAMVAGAPMGNDDIVIADNTLGEAPLQTPHLPRVLADATISASSTGTVGGRSLDGVLLANATDLLPGALQQRSTQNGPRKMTTTVGSVTCGGSPCDFDLAAETATQFAAFSTWRGGTLELYPGTHSGIDIGWPINVRGMGATPEDVTVRRAPAGFLADFGFFERHTSVIRFTFQMDDSIQISNLTIAVGPLEDGLAIEGSETTAPPTPHIVERIRVIDRGDTDVELANFGFWLGENVILHDALVIGGFQVCVRHGVRGSELSATPPTTNWIYNLTCRQTKTAPGQPLAAFEVASVVGSQWFNVAVEMAAPGPLFRAQRRATTADTDPVALDPPTSYAATAWVVRNRSADYDGYTDLEGTYTLLNVDEVLAPDPFFISDTDSRLDTGAAGLDSGVNPSTIDAMLPAPTTDLGGTSRSGRAIDRGAYEQGG